MVLNLKKWLDCVIVMWDAKLRMNIQVYHLLVCNHLNVTVSRGYCSRRLRRLRKTLGFRMGNRHKFIGKKITVEMLSDSRWGVDCLCCTFMCRYLASVMAGPHMCYQTSDPMTSPSSGICCWFWWRLSVHGVMPCSWSRKPTQSHGSASTCWHDYARLPSTVRSWRNSVRATVSMQRQNLRLRYTAQSPSACFQRHCVDV